jgi:hypothetical protein
MLFGNRDFLNSIYGIYGSECGGQGVAWLGPPLTFCSFSTTCQLDPRRTANVSRGYIFNATGS